MKRKTVILIGALALMLSGCSKDAVADSTTETSEIIESTEQVSETESLEQETAEMAEISDTETQTHEEMEAEPEYDSFGDILQVSVDEEGLITLDMGEGEYAELIKSVDRYNADRSEELKSIEAQGNDDAFCKVNLHRADKYSLSFLAKNYIEDYEEGPRYQTFDTYNFDAATGKQLALEDILTDTDQIDEIIKAQFEKYYSDETLDEQFFDNTVSENGYQWVVSYQGITFYFASEVLGEKEGTPIPVTILFDENPELFTEKCKDVPRAYAMDMDSKCQYLIDTDGDGDCEKVSTLYNVSGYEEIIDAELMIDDRKTVGNLEEGMYNRFSRTYFVHTASDKNFVLIYSEGIYDMMGMYVSFDMSGDSDRIDESEYLYLRDRRITDPYDIKVNVFDFITEMTTYYGSQKMNEKGMVVEDKEPVYTYSDVYARAYQDIEAAICDEQTGEPTDEKVMIKKEDKVQLISTDGHTWCNVRTEDNKIARVTFDECDIAEINGDTVFNIVYE